MTNAPDVSRYNLINLFTDWLLEHDLTPGNYLDPVQLSDISFESFINGPRGIQSGHIFPLDRGGVHHPENTFLMLFRSNQIQGNLTVEELLEFMRTTVDKHNSALDENNTLEQRIRGG